MLILRVGTERRMAERGQQKTSRRSFIRRTAATAGLAALGQTGLPAQAATGQATQGSQAALHQAGRRPNILILMVDEQRYPTSYESSALANFRDTALTTQKTLAQTGVSFRRHYAASVACVPSRTSLLTGQYPSLHGCSQTDGAAKSAVETDMYWLDANTVPTLGDYAVAAGYESYWIGKWHVSHGDILQPGTSTGLPAYDTLGQRDSRVEGIYQQANRLDDHGFTGWIGREPHGQDPRDSGHAAGIYKPTGQHVQSRDPAIGSQVLEQLQRLQQRPDGSPPWLMGASFLGPHDIALWGFFTRISQLFPQVNYTFDFSIDSDVPDFEDLFDRSLFAQTNRDDLSTKPRAQESYRDTYSQWMQPTLGPRYYRYYYQLHKLVDAELGRVYSALKQSQFFDHTIVVFTSDHGDLLGAHGGMHQKWYGAYDEATRVPFVISGPRVAAPGRHADIPTSHVDLIPTLLGLMGANAEQLRSTLSAGHTEARALVGRDLSGIVTGAADPQSLFTPIYFMTDDDPARGNNEANPIGLAAASVVQPNKLDTVVTVIDNQLWKYTEYRDDPAYWTTPQSQDYRDRPLLAPPTSPGTYTQPYEITLKTQPVQPEPRDYELYNLTTDPLELRNLALDSSYASMKQQLAQLLAQQRAQKRLTPGGSSGGSSPPPSNGTSPGTTSDGSSVAHQDPGEDTPRKPTETQRQQRERTNQLGLDDYRTEGNVIEVHADPPYVVIAMRDGRQVVHLACKGGCPTIQVGDYITVEGTKEHEQLFEATDVEVVQRGQPTR
jgi:choline-sulfatase